MSKQLLSYIQYTTPKGVKYYYEPIPKQTTYQFPANSVIIDSQTKKIIFTPPGVKAKIADQPEAAIQNTSNNQAQFTSTNTVVNSTSTNKSLTSQRIGPKSLQSSSQSVIPSLSSINSGPTNQIQSQSQTKIPVQSQQPPQFIPSQTSNFMQVSPKNQQTVQMQPTQLPTDNSQKQMQNIQSLNQFPQIQTQNPRMQAQFQQTQQQFQQIQMQASKQVQTQIPNQTYQQVYMPPIQLQQASGFPKQFPQAILRKRSAPDIQISPRISIPGQNPTIFGAPPPPPLSSPPNELKQNTISLNPQNMNSQPASPPTSRLPLPVRSSDSVPEMPDFLIPNQQLHEFSPWTINTADFPQVDVNTVTIPKVTLSKEASTFQSSNPFNYPERINLNFSTSGSGFSSSILDRVESSMSNAEDESSSSRPNSVRYSSNTIANNENEMKTPFLIIELIANAFKVTPDSIKTKAGFLELIDKYQIIDLVPENFRKQPTISSARKNAPSATPQYEEELSFSDKPLQKPLLKKVKNNLKPFGSTISTSILQFIGVIPGYNQIIVAYNLFKIIQPNQDLIDETFFQAIKQATNNPNPKWEENCYLFFLILCSFFKPRKSNRPYILSWAARHLFDSNHKLREFFGFAMIRFESRFLRGTYKDEISVNMIKNIPSQVDYEQSFFDCSIFELMWTQRKRYPLLPIPLPLAMIVKRLVKKDAVKTPNLFDLPSDSEKVEQLANDMLTDYEILKSASVGDLMGLLKHWLLSISDPLIPRSTFNAFLHYQSPLEYVNNMPSFHRDSLKYLVGFLKDILNNDEVNNTTGSKVADVFGPLIVSPTEVVHTREVYDAMISRSKEFLKSMLFTWQTNDIYPLSKELFDQARKEVFTLRNNAPNSATVGSTRPKRNSVCPLKVPLQLNPPNSH